MAGILDAIPVVGPLLQTGLDYATGNTPKQLANQQFGYSKDLAAYQNQLNMQSWMQQAQYNSPAQQMARFKAAGLNPNLIYGQGSNGNMSSPVELSAGAARQAVPSNSTQIVSKMLNGLIQAIQVKKELKGLDILDTEAKIKDKDLAIRDDESVRSGYLTYGDLFSYSGREKYSAAGDVSLISPYANRLKQENALKGYSADVKGRDLMDKIRRYELDTEFAHKERALEYQRGQQSYELEKYTKDPLFYYGDKILNNVVKFIPRMNSKTKYPSESQMIDKLRGAGHSVRKGVYGR